MVLLHRAVCSSHCVHLPLTWRGYVLLMEAAESGHTKALEQVAYAHLVSLCGRMNCVVYWVLSYTLYMYMSIQCYMCSVELGSLMLVWVYVHVLVQVFVHERWCKSNCLNPFSWIHQNVQLITYTCTCTIMHIHVYFCTRRLDLYWKEISRGLLRSSVS